MWLGKNKALKKTNEASKKEFSDEVKELNVQKHIKSYNIWKLNKN